MIKTAKVVISPHRLLQRAMIMKGYSRQTMERLVGDHIHPLYTGEVGITLKMSARLGKVLGKHPKYFYLRQVEYDKWEKNYQLQLKK